MVMTLEEGGCKVVRGGVFWVLKVDFLVFLMWL